MSATTANWHWKSKGVTPWARSWFEQELPTVILTKNDVTIGVSSLKEMEGDVELGMRKSKLITIFDVRMVMNWTATHADGAKATGSLTIPEVSHGVVIDNLDDYVYDWKLNKATPADDEPTTPSQSDLYSLVKKNLPGQLTKLFESFPQAIIDTHGKDLVATPTASGTATPVDSSNAPPVPSLAGSALAPSSLAPKPIKKVANSSTVRVEGQFMVSSADLFDILTNEARIPQWTRAPAHSKPEVGGVFSLFGDGVTGKYTAIDKPTSYVQTWKLKNPSWPEGHEAQLTTTLEESTDSTKLKLELQGVPKGQEDEMERNLIGY
ncbi:hypothetical protein DL93DRAFT_2062011 [Clavulina sp. PMI_390]|nr:hypothetical protein DL93DRAFT_2062011 [Clavulina sp. PMI_390]